MPKLSTAKPECFIDTKTIVGDCIDRMLRKRYEGEKEKFSHVPILEKTGRTPDFR